MRAGATMHDQCMTNVTKCLSLKFSLRNVQLQLQRSFIDHMHE